MRKRLCPQCLVPSMFVMNEAGDRLPVYVNEAYEVIPKHPDQSLEGYDLSMVHCLGCSWKGSPMRLK